MSVVFNPGDKVELVKGDEKLCGEMVAARVVFVDSLGISRELGNYEALGWSVSVVPSTPTPEPLPTEPWSVIRDHLGTAWVRQSDAMWRHQMGDLVYANVLANDPRRMPFVPLGSRESWRASWAADIADWFDKKSDAEGSIHWAGDAIRAQFGGAVVDE